MTLTTTPTWDAIETDMHPSSDDWTPRPWAVQQPAPQIQQFPGMHMPVPTGEAFRASMADLQAQAHAMLVPMQPAAVAMPHSMLPAAAHPVAPHHFPISRIVPPLSQRDGVFGLLIGLVVLAFPVAGAIGMGVFKETPKPVTTAPVAAATTTQAPAAGVGTPATSGTAMAANAAPDGSALPPAGGTPGAGAPASPAAAATNTAAAAAPGGATTTTHAAATTKVAGTAPRAGAPRPGGATTHAGVAHPAIGAPRGTTTPTHAGGGTAAPVHHVHPSATTGGGNIVITPTAAANPPAAAPPAAAAPAPAPQVQPTCAAPKSWSLSTPNGIKFDVHSQGEIDAVNAQSPGTVATAHC